MPVDAVLYTEINVFSISVLLIIAYKSAAAFQTTQGNFFNKSIWFVVAANAFDFLWKLGNEGILHFTTEALTFVNFGYFVCFGISTYYWFMYSECKVRSGLVGNRMARLLYLLPIVLLAALLISSTFNGCLFYYDENAVYHRGPLFYAQQVLAYGYIGIASFKNLARSFRMENYAYKEELFSAVYFMIPPVISLVAQIFFQDAPIFVLGITISFLMAYINAVNMMISIDSLTGIHNRRRFLVQLDQKAAILGNNEKLVFLFLDVDEFKQINDMYGHHEGDRVLKAVGAALEELRGRHGGICARFGGDEFVFAKIVARDVDAEDLKLSVRQHIRERCGELNLPRDIDVSIGYAEYPYHAESMAELIQTADRRMYEVKNEKKKICR